MAKDKEERELTKKREAVTLPIFLPFLGCPFRCIYCQQNTITAQADVWQPKQVAKAVERFVSYRRGQKKEVAFFGGTFTALPMSVQEQYLLAVRSHQELGDTIRLSTRPDCLPVANLALLKRYNVQTVELGIQSFSDKVLKASARGYTREQAIEAVKLLQSQNLRVTVQLMPFLPSCDEQSLAESLHTVCYLRPQEVRIYPTLVLAGTELERLYIAGKYSPVEMDKCVQVCCQWKRELEAKGIRVIKIGLHSDVALDAQQIVVGAYHPAFGELVRIQALYETILRKNPDKLSELVVKSKETSLYFGHNRLLLKKLKKRYGEFALRTVKSS